MSSKPGVKHDAGKARWDLLPFVAVGQVADVLTFGASKYTPEGWRSVPDWRSRYTAAALRHIAAWKRGEGIDMESGLPHLAHAACCLLFMAELDEPPRKLELFGVPILTDHAIRTKGKRK